MGWKVLHRNVTARLAVHNTRMCQLMREGNTKEDASKIAYDEIVDGLHDEEVKEEIKRIKEVQNKGRQ